MTRTLLSRVLSASACAAVVGVAVLPGAPVRASASPAPASSTQISRRCAPAAPGHRTCTVLSVVGAHPATASGRRPDAHGSTPPGLWPQDLQSAYNLGSVVASVGSNQTVAVVESLDNPSLEANLGTFRARFAMPACTTANGCFLKVDENGLTASNGGSFPPAGFSGWGLEAALDTEAVSAACPRCHILVVEAATSDDTDFITAINSAARLGATEMSLSFSGCEGAYDQLTTFDTALRNAGVPITASTGDSGYYASDNPNTARDGCAVGSPAYPASSQYVTAAGGTSLVPAAGARGWSETAWAYSTVTGGGSPWGGGSGCSTDEPKPAWQHDTGCAARRMVSDVSADADPNTGMAVYDTYDDNGWDVVGGTSLSSPLIAGIDALKGATGTGAQSWYSPAPALYDVTSGTNAPSAADCTGSQAYYCNASAGYDGPTGVGTPAGVPAPAHAVNWNGGASLGNGPLSNHDPQTVSPAPGIIDTFWRTSANTLELATYSGFVWHAAVNLGGVSGGTLASNPHPVPTGGGTVDVFWNGADGNLWHVYELNGSGSWSAPSTLGGGPLGGADPQPTSSGHGDVAVFWQGTDHNLWEAAYRPGAGWRVPIGLGSGPLNWTPHAAAYTTNSYDVFWRGTDNAIWHTYGSASGFSGPHTIGMGPIAGDPIAVEAAAYAINLYWPGTDGGLWHAWDASAWQGPQGYGGTVLSPPLPVVPSAGQVDVFWRGPGATNGDIWHLLNGSPAELFETSLLPVATAGANPTAFSWGGHEEVFWQGTDGNLWHDWTS